MLRHTMKPSDYVPLDVCRNQIVYYIIAIVSLLSLRLSKYFRASLGMVSSIFISPYWPGNLELLTLKRLHYLLRAEHAAMMFRHICWCE